MVAFKPQARPLVREVVYLRKIWARRVFCAGPVNGNKEGASTPPLQHRVAPNANGDLVRRGLRELKAVGELF